MREKQARRKLKTITSTKRWLKKRCAKAGYMEEVHITGSEASRCRWCEKTKTGAEMAICSFKPMLGGFTGVCMACMTGTEEEVAAREAVYLSLGYMGRR